MRSSNGSSTRRCLTTAALLLAGAALAASCSTPAPAPAAPAPPLPAATPLPEDAQASEQAIRFLEDRVKSDPDDFIAYNKLVGYYMQRMRETGNLDYLNLASRAAHASLDSLPAERNVGGLAALTQVEYASHDFAAARDHALKLRELDPGKLYPLQFLADALMELGDYDGAADTFAEIQRRSGAAEGSLNTETRLARLALLRGKPDEAEEHFTVALVTARSLHPVPRETVAWCYWQLGETAFSVGKYDVAEQRYRDALTTFPDYYRAVASLGRVLAAKGDPQSAIVQYEAVVRRLPDPTYVAALGDLYKLAGREKDAAAQYDLVEQIAHLSQINGVLYNRNLALFYADHDMKPDVAYENASREYETRKDVYGADALAWAALKAGKVDEARTAIADALRLGTRDAKLFYHAGMIARAAGDASGAKDYLERALNLSPQFDPLQATVARQTLESL